MHLGCTIFPLAIPMPLPGKRFSNAIFTAMATCIFCPNDANSKEDMFPRWILTLVQTRYPLYRKVGDKPATVTEDQEVRLPCVCMKCNNGWMSRLETKVQKYMGALCC